VALWTSPYKDLPKDRRFNLCADVDINDHRLIKSVACSHGSITLFIQTLYHDIAEYARANNLTVIDSDAFINYLRQRADSRFAATASARDGRDRVAGLCQNSSSGSNQPPAVPETTKTGQRGKRKQTKGLV